jgi:hypothetical protein
MITASIRDIIVARTAHPDDLAAMIAVDAMKRILPDDRLHPYANQLADALCYGDARRKAIVVPRCCGATLFSLALTLSREIVEHTAYSRLGWGPGQLRRGLVMGALGRKTTTRDVHNEIGKIYTSVTRAAQSYGQVISDDPWAYLDNIHAISRPFHTSTRGMSYSSIIVDAGGSVLDRSEWDHMYMACNARGNRPAQILHISTISPAFVSPPQIPIHTISSIGDVWSVKSA